MCTFTQLMAEHVDYTHMVITSIVGKKGTTLKVYLARLMVNQDHIGKAVDSTELVVELREHIRLAGDIVTKRILVKAEKGTNVTLDKIMKEAETKWFANGRNIALLLHEMAPKKLPLEKIEAAMVNHLNITSQEVDAVVRKDMQNAVALLDEARDQFIGLGHMLAKAFL